MSDSPQKQTENEQPQAPGIAAGDEKTEAIDLRTKMVALGLSLQSIDQLVLTILSSNKLFVNEQHREALRQLRIAARLVSNTIHGKDYNVPRKADTARLLRSSGEYFSVLRQEQVNALTQQVEQELSTAKSILRNGVTHNLQGESVDEPADE